jgi:cyclomaltodextrinase / maltogenic alpha-amylase / neopullulanase
MMRQPGKVSLFLLVLTIFGGHFIVKEAMAEVIVKRRVKNQPRYKVQFRYQPVIAVDSVNLAGTFNGWRKDSTTMKERGSSGVYEVELELSFGKHEYKFVLNGKTWLQDGSNSESQPDGNGGLNSVVHIGRRAAAGEGKIGDGKIHEEDVIHDPRSLVFASAVDDDRRVILRLHVLKNDIKSVMVAAQPGLARSGRHFAEMEQIATVAGRDVYEARLFFKNKIPKVLRYRFLIHDGDQKPQIYGRKGLGPQSPYFQLVLAHAGRFETPDWVRDAVFYQIFPDRFRNGDPKNDFKGLRNVPVRPKGRRWSKNDAFFEKWGSKPSYFNFFGGDLRGIEEKLDYIKDLGINTIYLNPIFKSFSNHRYDAADFELVDPRLGTEEDFKRLCAKAKMKGLRIILDAVFNHTGDKHYAFDDLRLKGPRSRYKNWFFVDKFPIKGGGNPSYKCWWNFPDLPQLNTANPKVVGHLMKVATKWLKLGGSGWRLDVPNEVEAVNPRFWKEFRQKVRATREDSYIVGEIWTDAAPWLNEDKFDATMNYPVRRAVIDYLIQGDISAEIFDAALSEQRARLPEAALRVQFNLLGSHDTARLKFVAKEDSNRVKLAYGFLFSYLGAPVVYYGDEVGMTGDKDPDCRRTFPWQQSKQDQSMKEWIQSLAKLRRDEPSLRRGLVKPALARGAHYAFWRIPDTQDPGRPLLVVMNNSSTKTSITIPTLAADLPKSAMTDLLKKAAVSRDNTGSVKVELAAYGIAILAKN